MWFLAKDQVLLFFKIYSFVLKVKVTERERLFILLLYYPRGFQGQCWASQKPGARELSGSLK